jgi:hypothetical protein
MKKKLSILLLLIASITLQSCAIVEVQTADITKEKVIEIENLKQNELYVKANNWMVSAFNNAESVIQFTDKESGTITGKYLLGTVVNANEYGPANRAYAIINIQVKDGATKITIKPQPFKYAKGNPYTLYTKEDAENDINNLLVSFENTMLSETSNDW